MSKKVNTVDQTEINNILWQACDTFRGIVNATDYKNYILIMLFVKYISDTWEEHYQELEKEYGDDSERIKRRLERERFLLPDGCHFKNLFDQRNESNIGEIINIALEKIEDANKAKLEGVFRNVDFNSEANLGKTKDRNGRLKSFLQDFNNPKLDLSPSKIGNLDVIGNAYEYLIGKFAAGAGQKAGEFYTPAEVSELLAELIDPEKGDRIYDPACGSGSLLIKCANQVKKSGKKDFALYGQELNGQTWALAKMNMFLHGVDSARLEWGDTLREPKLLQQDTTMKFEVVVANPPFSLDKWGHEEATSDLYNRFHRGLPPKTKGDYAFISHMIESITEENGRVGVILPHGVLFRGSSEGKIRKKIIDENLLDAVIGLPSNLFFGTSIPTVILIFKKNKKADDVIFIDASKEFLAGKNQNYLREEDISKIVNTYKKRSSLKRYSKNTSKSNIVKNAYNLNIPRYVETYEAPKKIDVKSVHGEIENIEKDVHKLKEKMNLIVEAGTKKSNLKNFTLADLGDFFRGKGISKKELSESGIPCLRYAEIYTQHNYRIKEFKSYISPEIKNTSFLLKEGDIIFAGSGETVKDIGKSVAFVDSFEAYAGGDSVIFRPKVPLNSIYLSYLLNSPLVRRQLIKLGQGHTVVHVYAKDLATIEVSLPEIDEQNEIVEILLTWDRALTLLEELKAKTSIEKYGLIQSFLGA